MKGGNGEKLSKSVLDWWPLEEVSEFGTGDDALAAGNEDSWYSASAMKRQATPLHNKWVADKEWLHAHTGQQGRQCILFLIFIYS